MSKTFSFLRLPPELRNQIYEYVSLSCGAYLTPSSKGAVISPCSLLLVCRSVGEEYRHLLQYTAPVITAQVYDFDFAHIVTFLDHLLSRQAEVATSGSLALSKRPLMYRHLELVLVLTRECRQHLERLETWLDRKASQPLVHYSTSFNTTYAIHSSNTAAGSTSTIAPITLMRIIDEIYHNWYLATSAGPRKEEIGKICDCLGEAEMRINRMRTNMIPSGPRMGGLEVF